MRPVFRRADCRCDVRCGSETERTSKGIPPPTCLRGGPTDKLGKCLQVSPTCELNATDRELKSDNRYLSVSLVCSAASRP